MAERLVPRKRKLSTAVRRGPFPAPSTTARLNDLSMPHIESFNFMLDGGLQLAVADIPPREFKLSNGDTMHIWLEDVAVGHPMKSDSGAEDPRLYPTECRERGMTYAAPLNATVCRRINDGEPIKLPCKLGDVPIMIRSSRCHLNGLGPVDLVAKGEEAVEFGGYFICNGIERIIRMLQIPKRNHPMAITRNAYLNRGPLYSNKGIMIRCARPDQSSVSLTLHYLNDGSATVRFTVRKQEFFLPVIMVLKALVPTSDREIYERVLAGDVNNTYLSDRVLMLLRDAKKYEAALHSREAALVYLGARFRTVLDVPASISDADAGQVLLDRYVLVHLTPGAAGARDKFNLLILMLRKLYAFVAGSVLEDNPDSLCNQELLLSGHLILLFLKEKLYELTQGIETAIQKEDSLSARQAAARASKKSGGAVTAGLSALAAAKDILPVDASDSTWFKKIVDRQPPVGKKLYYLLATGNLVSSSGLDLMQVSGYTVVADKINFMRFTTHFRSVHRGQFFAEMKTTTVRKLLPENWGFLCPIHTPDGGPCGLLNHLAAPALVVAHPLSQSSFAEVAAAVSAAAAEECASKGLSPNTGKLPSQWQASLTALLVALGMTPHAATGTVMPASHLPVMLDGRVLGGAPPHTIHNIMRALRYAKAHTAGVAAGLERVGDGQLAGQGEAVNALTRAAVLGMAGISGHAAAAAAAAADAEDEEEGGGARSSVRGPSAGNLSALGGLAAVPASLEVAFLPPAWWDAEVDPHIRDGDVAARRAAQCSMLSGSGSGSKSSSGGKAEAEEKKGEGDTVALVGTGTGLAADDDPQAPTKLVSLFPGLFLSAAPQRLVRPVLQLDTGLVELISPLEQPYMDIACMPEDVEDILRRSASLAHLSNGAPGAVSGTGAGTGTGSGAAALLTDAASDKLAAAAAAEAEEKHQKKSKKDKKDKKGDGSSSSDAIVARKSGATAEELPLIYTHIELSPVAMLSEVAALTPFSDLNQSPRNMYQCLSADHDVLTCDGWRSIAAVEVGEMVMTFNPATGCQEWNSVQAKTDMVHDGQLYRLSSAKMDAVVTAEHRWLMNSVAARDTWAFYTTRTIVDGRLYTHRNHAVPLVGRNTNPLYTFDDCAAFLPAAVRTNEAANLDWCRLIGFVLGDGGTERVTDAEGQQYYYTCMPGVQYVDGFLGRLHVGGDALAFTKTLGGDGKYTYRSTSTALYDFFAPMMTGVVGYDPCDDAATASYDHAEAYRRARSGPVAECTTWVAPVSGSTVSPAARTYMRRWLYYPWANRLSRNQARALIEGFMAASAGSPADSIPLIQQGHVRGFSSSLPLIHDLCVLALLAEGRPEVAVWHKKGDAVSAVHTANTTCWCLTVSFEAEELEARIPKPQLYANPAHNGRVYCMTVANGNFLARRKTRWGAAGAVEEVLLSPFYTGNCQMGKQTMGTPLHSWPHRTDTKLFRLQTPQAPVVQNAAHAEYGFDEYPSGANACVAVIAYTGFDMEDACIISKNSFERGFGHASVYKVYEVDLVKDRPTSDFGRFLFHNMYVKGEQPMRPEPKGSGGAVSVGPPPRPRVGDLLISSLDEDGLPPIGLLLQEGDPMYAVLDSVTNTHKVVKHKDVEPAYVDEVRILGPTSTSAAAAHTGVQRVSIKLRFDRRPVVGDKFSSRHGQKGVLSMLWPTEDMPFTDAGMVPDVIINPHAFPSRMTIGMLVESMAGKAGALHGNFQDATPFRFDEQRRAVDYFGEQLRAAGYNYYGTETMYSGVTGEPLAVDIYYGVVYYQRLRHMVKDKAQVRSTGPINNLTRQPVKGRKKGGGIRFGEMERDSLLAHGAAFLLHDRLHNSSDRHLALVCKNCGSMLATHSVPSSATTLALSGDGSVKQGSVDVGAATDGAAAARRVNRSRRVPVCRACGQSDAVVPVPMPYVFRYLANELAGMNIKIKLELGEGPYS